MYKGTVGYTVQKSLQQRYELKFSGVIFPHTLKALCREMVLKWRKGDKSGGIKRLSVLAPEAEEKSKLFSHNELIQRVDVGGVPGQEYKVVFA